MLLAFCRQKLVTALIVITTATEKLSRFMTNQTTFKKVLMLKTSTVKIQFNPIILMLAKYTCFTVYTVSQKTSTFLFFK